MNSDCTGRLCRLSNSSLANAIKRDLAMRSCSFLVPHLIDVEVASALRKLTLDRRLDSHRSRRFLKDLASLPAERYPHTPLLERIWELRHNFTAYDAAYIALAEATNAVLYTCDEKLANGHCAPVRLFAAD